MPYPGGIYLFKDNYGKTRSMNNNLFESVQSEQ